jgi:hypothetical protein
MKYISQIIHLFFFALISISVFQDEVVNTKQIAGVSRFPDDNRANSNTCQLATPVSLGSCDIQLDITDGTNTFDGPAEVCSGNSVTGAADAWAMFSIPVGIPPGDVITIQYDNTGVSPVPDIAISVYTDCNDLAGSLMGCVDNLTEISGNNVEGVEYIQFPTDFFGPGDVLYIRVINKTPMNTSSGSLSVFLAPTISCPSDITVSNDAGACDAIVTYTVPFADNCSGSTISQTAGLASGSAFPIGTTINTFVVTDAVGNSVSCSFTVTVQDTTAPVISLNGPASITLEACTDTYTEQGATATDNCSVGAVTVGGDVVDVNTPGTYTVTYNVTDANGVDAIEVTRTITVQDTTAPVITLNGPASITLEACTDTYTEQGATATDNCSVGAVTVGGDVVDVNTPGTYTVTYNVTDANGVDAIEVTRTITVQDTTAPVITLNGPASITLEACTDTYTEQGATATDNCSVGAVTVGGDVVDVNTPGTYTVTYNVTDANGVDAIEVTRTITVQDTTAPVISLNGPASITLEACTDTYTEQGATATDNCSVGAVTVGGDVVDVNTPGTYTVTYNVTDANGVAAIEVTRTITVQDTTAPLITLNGPASITLEACTDTYTEQGATATDNCSVGAVTVGGDVVDVNTPGTYTVTYNVTDANGVAAIEVTRTITVQDTTAPLITLNGPASITLEACTDTYTEQGATATDNCSVGAVTVGGDVVDVNTPGTYTVTYNVTDANGVAAIEVTRTITVQDTTAPVISLNGPASITLEACTDTYTEQGATATDNCSVGAVTVGGDVVDVNTPGTYTVTYNVTDANGVAAIEVTRTITVQDTTAPVISLNGPASITLEACTDTYTEQGATATDNCSVGAVTVGGDVVDVNTPGTYTVTYNVTDANGVAAIEVTRTITVQDTTAPVITLNGPASITLEACTDTYTEQGATATDNCSVGAVTVGGDVVDVNTPGTYTVTYNVTDANGVAAIEVTRTITVQDTTAPVISLNGPASITLEACTDTYTEQGATATDNCSVGAVTVGGDVVDVNTPGTYTVTYNVTDANGVAAIEVTRTVTVQDTTAPVITLNGPANITLEACTDTYTEQGATATDNCSVGAVTVGGDVVDVNTPGTYTVTYNVTDANGVAAIEVTRTITVQDTTAPLITLNGPASITLEACTDTYTEQGATATDNCSVGAVTVGGDVVDVNTPGTYTVTYNVTDANGVDAIEVTRTITVQDTTAPLITLNGPANITLEACTDTYTEQGATATDNCSVGAVTVGGDVVDVNTPGTYTVTYNVTDANGVAAIEVTRTITVQDTTAPTVICQDITIQLNPANGLASIIPADIDNGSTDNCGIASISLSQDTFDCSNIGANTVTLTVTDNNSNVSTCTATVTVNEPIIAAPGAISGPDSVCQGQNGVNYSISSITNAVNYVWSVPSGAIIVAGNGTNNIVVDYDITATSGDITVYAENVCGTAGPSATLPVTVNITPIININYSEDICSGDTAIITPLDGGGNIVPVGTTFSWGLPTISGGITGATSESGQSSFNQTLVNTTNIPQTAAYNITASNGSCAASTFTIVITVNPTPQLIVSPLSQSICSGEEAVLSLSESTGISGNITYEWTRTNSNITGIANSGSTSLSDITANLINTTGVVQTTQFTIIAVSDEGCESTPINVDVTVQPTPLITATPVSQLICSEDTITTIVLGNSNGVAGTTYSWTRNNTANLTGIPASGTGSNIAGSLTNNTNIAQTTVFTVTAQTANGCQTSTDITITVNPRPTVNAVPDTQIVCSDEPISTITITNPNSVAGTTFSWTRNNTTNVTGIPNNGTGSTINGVPVNNTNSNQTIIFTITAVANGCSTSTTVELIVRPTPQVVATPAAQTICDGDSFLINLSNSNNVPGTTYTWTRTNTGNITGLPASGSGNAITATLNNTSSTTQTTTFTITATANGCSTTTTATVTVYAPLTAPVIGDSQDVCLNQSPGNLDIKTSPSGGSGNYSYQWQFSNSGVGGWTNIPGANNTIYSPPNMERYYRLIVTDIECGTLISNVVTISYTFGLGGILGGLSISNSPDINSPLCSGDSFTSNFSIEHTTSSTVDFFYSANSTFISPSSGIIDAPFTTSGPWWNRRRTSVGSVNYLVQNTTNQTVTTQIFVTPEYDVRIFGFSYTCNGETETIDVTIRPTPIAFATGDNNTICSGDIPGISISGNITDGPMRFFVERNNTTNVSGVPTSGTIDVAAGANFEIPFALTNTTGIPQDVTYTITPYSNYGTNDCVGTPITVTVTVAPEVDGGTISNTQTICEGDDPIAFTQTPSSGTNLTYQWQSSTDNINWSPITGATGLTYDAPAGLTQTTWYRRTVSSNVNGTICTAISNTVQIILNEIEPGNINGAQTLCNGSTPSVLGSIQAANGSGSITYQWQSSTSDCTTGWTDISGATSETYSATSGITQTTFYRRLATSTLNGISCTEASNCVVATVNEVVSGNIGSDEVICGNNPNNIIQLSVSSGSGTLSYRWEISTDNVNWSTIAGANGISYNPPAGVTVPTFYRRVTISTLNGVACEAISNIIEVTPNIVTAGVIAGNRTVCSGGDPVGFTETVAATGTNLSYQWQSSTDNVNWSNITGATNINYDETGPVDQNTFYRRVATGTINGVSCSAISNSITVFVNEVTASVIAGNQTVCSTDDPAAFSVSTIATGTGTITYQWQNSIDNTTWSNILGGTSATYNPPILSQTTWYRVIVSSTLNGVSCTELSNELVINVTSFVDAAVNIISPAPVDCDDTRILLDANGTGEWSATSSTGNSFSFSNINDPNASFTGESGGSYEITWTLFNASPCGNSQDVISVNFPNCGDNIDFDGVDDIVSFRNNFNQSGSFSIEAWIKPNSVSGTQTIYSKRNSNNLNTGYDLRLTGSTLSFRWNDGGQVSAAGLTTNRWYHTAITYDGSIYRLYVDGIEIDSNTGSIPASNTMRFLLGAMDRINNTPTNYFNGWMDELRIWNVSLNTDQIREMMNQEIEQNVTNVRGSVLRLNITGLNWSNLQAYYQMNQSTDVNSGTLSAITGSVDGSLINMTSLQEETAPLPYVSEQDGVWDNAATWFNGTVQQIPNTNGIDGTTLVNWNIVRTQTNVNSGNRATTVLGLLVDNNRYSITNNQELFVSKYLRIDGVLDLEGESQLLQPSGSVVDYTSNGHLERDQQGTSNLFNYNYWGSPVSTAGAAGNRTYNIGSILYDGNNPVNWTANVNANSTTNPKTLSSRWLYRYPNGVPLDYNAWQFITPSTAVDVGLGYTMKGSGAGTTEQNYTFRGLPNNGDISINVSGGNISLVGNPYPSAIDSHTFIIENQTVLDEGTLIYWEHAPSNNTHLLREYLGTYAYYNLIGGVTSIQPPDINGPGDTGGKVPGRFVPIAQGFFVEANSSGGSIVFNNEQRAFVLETSGSSTFMRSTETSFDSNDESVYEDHIQRLRIKVTTSENAGRYLLLGFTPDDSATDEIDYGYDAKSRDNLTHDAAWSINGENFVIQGVGAYDESKMYPLNINLATSGNISIELIDLENFEEPIDVFIYDAILDTYTPINDYNFEIEVEAGEVLERFFVTFREEDRLSVKDELTDGIYAAFLNSTSEIYIITRSTIRTKQVYLVNMVGQTVRSWNATNTMMSQEFRIPVRNLSEGTYILRVQTDDGQDINKKVIVKY